VETDSKFGLIMCPNPKGKIFPQWRHFTGKSEKWDIIHMEEYTERA
jgi:hypothetical protein